MSATVEFFEQDFIVGQYECDCNGRMKAGALMAQSQAISTNHCNELGLTIDVYRRTHTVFLLAKASLEIYHDIKVGDKLRVVTRPSGPKRAIYNRYTSFINEQGIEVAAQDSKWVLVDTDTRKILRDPPEDLDFPFRIQEIPEQDLSIPKVRDAQQTAVERVTYSRTDDNGHFIWPGFGDNMRVLMWMLARCEGKVDAVETPIGYVPKAEDINIEGLSDITLDVLKGLLEIDNDLWLEDVKGVEELYDQIGERVPAELRKQLADLRARLSK